MTLNFGVTRTTPVYTVSYELLRFASLQIIESETYHAKNTINPLKRKTMKELNYSLTFMLNRKKCSDSYIENEFINIINSIFSNIFITLTA